MAAHVITRSMMVFHISNTKYVIRYRRASIYNEANLVRKVIYRISSTSSLAGTVGIAFELSAAVVLITFENFQHCIAV